MSRTDPVWMARLATIRAVRDLLWHGVIETNDYPIPPDLFKILVATYEQGRKAAIKDFQSCIDGLSPVDKDDEFDPDGFDPSTDTCPMETNI